MDGIKAVADVIWNVISFIIGYYNNKEQYDDFFRFIKLIAPYVVAIATFAFVLLRFQEKVEQLANPTKFNVVIFYLTLVLIAFACAVVVFKFWSIILLTILVLISLIILLILLYNLLS